MNLAAIADWNFAVAQEFDGEHALLVVVAYFVD